MGAQFFRQYRSHLYLFLALVSTFGLYTFYDRRPQPEPIQIIAPTDTVLCPAETITVQPTVAIRVHVVGAVMQPGVYILGQDARIVDAVQAAGGMNAEADSEAVNLADRIGDGQQIRVPQREATLRPSPTPMPQPTMPLEDAGAVAAVGQAGLVNINTASTGELESLPGIGPVLAQRIVTHREENGPFATEANIMDVFGIGEGYYARIRDLITVK